MAASRDNDQEQKTGRKVLSDAMHVEWGEAFWSALYTTCSVTHSDLVYMEFVVSEYSSLNTTCNYYVHVL